MRYFVITPEYERYPGNRYGDPEPPEYGCDVVEVEASTKREAKVKGVQELRRTKSSWMQDQVSDGHCPFTGLKVEPQYDPETCPKHEVYAHCPDPWEPDAEDANYCDTCGYE